MAFPLTDAQKQLFLGSHEMSFTCTVLRGSESLGQIKIIEADVSATYGTQGGRDGSFYVDSHVIDRGLLLPESDQVIISTGIPGVIDVPIFTGRVDELSEFDDGSVRVQLLSRGAEVIRAAFEIPWAAGPAGTPAAGEMQKIITSVDPSWGVDISMAQVSPIPSGLVWETDPGQALDQLAQSASLIWQPDRTGGFVIYTNPFQVPTASVIMLRDGTDGTVVRVDKNTSRIGVYNSITVVTERVNNTAPVRVTVRDANPSSPTYWGGLFGKQNLVVKNQTPLTVVDSQALAVRILRQSLALQRSFNITVPHMPFLDPGDVFVLWYQDVVFTLVVETISYSTSAQKDTVISARELMLDPLLELEVV